MKMQLRLMDENAKKRQKRKNEWNALFEIKPSPDYEDPVLNEEIENVKNNLGDYKLKSASNYKVPEEGGLTANRSRFFLLEILEKSHDMRETFNNSLIGLRDEKVALIKQLNKLNSRLQEIGHLLPHNLISFTIRTPELQDDEQPEKIFEYTERELNAFEEQERAKVAGSSNIQKNRMEFANVLLVASDDREKQLVEERPNTVILEMNDLAQEGLGYAQPKSKFKLGIAAPRPEMKAFTNSAVKTPEDATGPEKFNQLEDESEMMMEVHSQSRMQDENQVAGRIFYETQKLLKEQQEILVGASRSVRCFDTKLKTLVYSRSVLAPLIKRMELQIMTTYREYRLLKDYEESEQVLTTKKKARKAETDELKGRIADLLAQIENKKREIERLGTDEQELLHMVIKEIGEEHKYNDFLLKVYRKKIKRKKQEEKNEDESESDSSDSDSDLDDNEMGSDEEVEQLDLDACPPACPQADYDRVVLMREKRLDTEEILSEEKKALEALKKEVDGQNKKLKGAESSFKQAASELEAYQLEKQRKVNEFEVLVTLRKDQVLLQMHDKNQINDSMKDMLVFLQSNWQKLRDRIHELQEERERDLEEKRETIKHHKLLRQHKNLFQEEINKSAKECDQLMVQKFGKMVDLAKLETLIINPKLEELKEQLNILQKGMDKELAEYDFSIKEAQSRNLESLRENTRQVTKALLLFNEQEELRKALDKAQQSKSIISYGLELENYQELKALENLLKQQAEEIRNLQHEISALSCKTGTVYPPIPIRVEKD
ncbi:Cilia- and flagella-associated protein 44 [Cichlidogyrus casuarinus]|uniref:Cilia- and flagella-associated protein 44 n=1 Tax=Cichlidogyrus casuarinus TaxID=1844966 RepID=A0ABD2QHB0_9PLAT